LHERVAWLTGRVLARWRKVSTSRAAPRSLRGGWDRGAEAAADAGDTLLGDFGHQGSVDWEAEDDPFFMLPSMWGSA
jgi:hypothetical protein